MASLPELRSGTATVHRVALNGATVPVVDQPQNTEETPPRDERRRTASKVERTEKGDVRGKDEFTSDSDLEAAKKTVQLAAEKRKELAASVVRAIARVSSSCGSPRMAADLQVLKRELSRCHAVLGPFPSESDFLSIVVLVEAELGNKSWSTFTKHEMLFLKRAVEVGVLQDRVSFNDYNRHLRTLTFSGYPTGPVIEFDEGREEEDPDE